MGKIKGWKKIRITHQPKPKYISWIIGIWKSNNSEIIIKKEGVEYIRVRKFQGVTQGYIIFKTKQLALDNTIKYMRLHPNG